jgi:hypothetical protein
MKIIAYRWQRRQLPLLGIMVAVTTLVSISRFSFFVRAFHLDTKIMPSSTTNIRQKQKQRQHHMKNNSEDDILSCRILGFYPSPTPPPKGFWGWLLKDIHQAIIIESSMYKNQKLLMDFMTKDGGLHPVWYNENVKLGVMLGSTIKGEVRIRVLGGKTGRRQRTRRRQQEQGREELEVSKNLQEDYDDDCNDRIQQQKKNENIIEEISAAAAKAATTAELTSDETETVLNSSKMGEILQIAQSYDTSMNLYRNNCRIFCANMEREVERVNQQATRTSSHTVTSTIIISEQNNNNNNNNNTELLGATTTTTSMILTDCRWILRIFLAALLPTLSLGCNCNVIRRSYTHMIRFLTVRCACV